MCWTGGCWCYQFLIEGSTLTIVGLDIFGNIRVYAFDPQDPATFKGKKLLSKAAFYSGGRVSSVTRLTARPSEAAAAAGGVGAASHRIGCLLSSFDASMGVVLPLDETTFKRMQSLQRKLITSVVQPAGLNPAMFR